jgi:dCMP deaminase
MDNLSLKAQALLQSWEHIPHNRPSWDLYFLNLANEVSKRSSDPQSQFGCIIVNIDNRIIGLGYNGFVGGIDDSVLPNIRPFKYDFMLHSEINALFNCSEKPKGATAYITGRPCLHCFQCLVQSGIKRIVHNNKKAVMNQSDDDNTKYEILLYLTKNLIKVEQVECIQDKK